jgi:transposase
VVSAHDISDEPVELVERVCGIDIGKSALMACVRVPHESRPGRRGQEIRELGTTHRELLGLADWLRCQQVETGGHGATSDYWKPVFYLLEAHGLRCWLLNGKHVKNLPGRRDRQAGRRLAGQGRRAGHVSAQPGAPKAIRRLRDLTRYRRSLVREHSREKQRLEKTLEDAQIKLDTVVASLHSVSGRAMLEAMIAGQRDPHVLAGMARGVMRRKIPQLEEALRGHFDDHHGFICATVLRRIDAPAADIATPDPIGHSGTGPGGCRAPAPAGAYCPAASVRIA